MKRKKGTRYKKSNKNKLIPTIFLIFFIGLLIFSGTKIINYIIESQENKKITEEIEKLVTIEEDQENKEGNKYSIDFDNLKERNSDTVGFIKVNGTDIKHIVVQGNDNSYYLYHNFNKEKNSAGWIFADYRNKFNGTDKNIIIYGHNMKNGTMFSSLKNILNDEWYKKEENRSITFSTENENSIYEVFSVYQIESEDYYMKTEFKNNGEFNKYIETMKSRSKYNFNVDVDENDNILTLSTCADNNKYRVVLHARKISI